MSAKHSTRGIGHWTVTLLPALLIIVWVLIASIGGPYFGRVSEVSTNDSAAFLPANAESTLAGQEMLSFVESDAVPAIVVFQRDGGLTSEDITFIDDRSLALTEISGIPEASPVLMSDDGKAAEVVAPILSGYELRDTVRVLSEVVVEDLPPGLSAYITGPAGFASDLVSAFGGIDGILLVVALIAVFVILLIVYRSLLLPIVVLLTSVFALSLSILVVWWLAKWELIQLNGQSQGILFILVIGACTDYSLLLVARHRDALRDHAAPSTAVMSAVRSNIEPILASAGTVIAGLLCLLFSDLNSNRSLGPIASVGIVCAVLAALTFLPALLSVLGRSAFWPNIPKYGSPHPVIIGEGAKGLWSRVVALVARRPRAMWIGTSLLLVVLAIPAVGLKATGVQQSDLVLVETSSAAGQEVLAEHFAAGTGTPVMVFVPESAAEEALQAIESSDNFSSAFAQTDGPGGAPMPGAEALVVDGRVMLNATLEFEPDSAAAEQAVVELRNELHQLAEGVLVGGETATAVDTNETSISDRERIIPIILLVILIVLMLLLRSLLAPVLLVATTVVSYFSALGVSALVFNHVLDFPGADPVVPLYGFVFLVALGIDYNIFLMTRVREESLIHGTQQGVLRGLGLTGSVITSAGVVLAATFAALAVIPILFLVQLAFIVAFGVLLDTLIVRSLLVPGLAYDIGRTIWWPSKLSRSQR